MSDNLNTFPSNKYEALTMLYLENQDLSELTPEKLLDKYVDTYNQIRKYASSKRNPQTVKTYHGSL